MWVKNLSVFEWVSIGWTSVGFGSGGEEKVTEEIMQR